MGNTWEVHEWYKDITRGENYKYHLQYGGPSLLKAIFVMIKLRRNGAKCLKLEWRQAEPPRVALPLEGV